MGHCAPVLLLLLLLSWSGPLGGQQQHLVEYMERRLVALEERLAQCQDQSSRHAAELRDFKNKMLPLLEVAEKEREALRTEADTIAGRVDRLEREVDYLETQNPALPCEEVNEKVPGGSGTKGKGRRNEKYDMVTGAATTTSSCPPDAPDPAERSQVPGPVAHAFSTHRKGGASWRGAASPGAQEPRRRPSKGFGCGRLEGGR